MMYGPINIRSACSVAVNCFTNIYKCKTMFWLKNKTKNVPDCGFISINFSFKTSRKRILQWSFNANKRQSFTKKKYIFVISSLWVFHFYYIEALPVCLSKQRVATHPTMQCRAPKGTMSQNCCVLKGLLLPDIWSRELKCFLYVKRTVQMHIIEC